MFFGPSSTKVTVVAFEARECDVCLLAVFGCAVFLAVLYMNHDASLCFRIAAVSWG